VHLVAHSKKPDARRPEIKYWPGKHDVRGSVHVTDLAHNTICVWRNRKKEQDLNTAWDEKLSDEVKDAIKQQHDAMMIVLAQRGGEGEEPVKKLWFDQQRSWQYWDDRPQSKQYVGVNNGKDKDTKRDEPVEDKGRSSFFT